MFWTQIRLESNPKKSCDDLRPSNAGPVSGTMFPIERSPDRLWTRIVQGVTQNRVRKVLPRTIGPVCFKQRVYRILNTSSRVCEPRSHSALTPAPLRHRYSRLRDHTKRTPPARTLHADVPRADDKKQHSLILENGISTIIRGIEVN